MRPGRGCLRRKSDNGRLAVIVALGVAAPVAAQPGPVPPQNRLVAVSHGVSRVIRSG